MTVLEMAALIDQCAYLHVDGIDVAVKIADARTRFGETDVLIVPLSGKGQRWVRLHTVSLW